MFAKLVVISILLISLAFAAPVAPGEWVDIDLPGQMNPQFDQGLQFLNPVATISPTPNVDPLGAIGHNVHTAPAVHTHPSADSSYDFPQVVHQVTTPAKPSTAGYDFPQTISVKNLQPSYDIPSSTTVKPVAYDVIPSSTTPAAYDITHPTTTAKPTSAAYDFTHPSSTTTTVKPTPAAYDITHPTTVRPQGY